MHTGHISDIGSFFVVFGDFSWIFTVAVRFVFHAFQEWESEVSVEFWPALSYRVVQKFVESLTLFNFLFNLNWVKPGLNAF
jgi:hypothetical protein